MVRERRDCHPQLHWDLVRARSPLPHAHAQMCTVSISSTCLAVEPFLFSSFTLCVALAAASYGRRGANRHWRVAGNREKNRETPFGGLHVQIWGRTQVERGLLVDLIHTGGGQLLSQQSQDHDVR